MTNCSSCGVKIDSVHFCNNTFVAGPTCGMEIVEWFDIEIDPADIKDMTEAERERGIYGAGFRAIKNRC